jgi:heme-degrading monooxygenase HmoA
MTFISITRLRVRSWRFLPLFFLQAVRSARQAKKAPGNRGVSVLREARNVFWTRTAWESEAAMKAYMLAGAHRQVMRKLLDWCDEAAVAHWTQEPAEEPTWQEAHAQLVKIGRLSKVNRPSKAQSEFQIPAPLIPPGQESRF